MNKNIMFDELESLLAGDMTKLCPDLYEKPDEISADSVLGSNTSSLRPETNSADAGADARPDSADTGADADPSLESQ